MSQSLFFLGVLIIVNHYWPKDSHYLQSREKLGVFIAGISNLYLKYLNSKCRT